jgi:hypothetical protein
MTMVTSMFVSALQVSDARFDLSVYGSLFKEIPRRLGRNAALDASVGALTTALPWVHTHHRSADMFDRYAHALKSLRASLDDPVQARSADTLCAVYLIVICHASLKLASPTLPPSRRILCQ